MCCDMDFKVHRPCTTSAAVNKLPIMYAMLKLLRDCEATCPQPVFTVICFKFPDAVSATTKIADPHQGHRLRILITQLSLITTKVIVHHSEARVQVHLVLDRMHVLIPTTCCLVCVL